MKQYRIGVAQDVPHYGSVYIEAANDQEAIREASKLDPKTLAEECTDPEFDSATCLRVTVVEDESDDRDIREVAHDIDLDEYRLHFVPNGDPKYPHGSAQPVMRQIETMAESLDNFSPAAFEALLGVLDEQAGDFSLPASRRRLYHLLKPVIKQLSK